MNFPNPAHESFPHPTTADLRHMDFTKNDTPYELNVMKHPTTSWGYDPTLTWGGYRRENHPPIQVGAIAGIPPHLTRHGAEKWHRQFTRDHHPTHTKFK